MNAYESGQTLGRYRIVRPLGMGAMGRVYLAEDPRIERLLAIKTVRVEGGHSEVEDRKRRLLREAKAAGKLSHHHVVTLYDAGEDGDTLFLVFEYIKGSDLAARLEAGPPMSLAEALRAVRQAAEGLDYAHQQGIVHRDIKPSNLMLDERGWVKVSDFGIAKLAGQSTELTMTGSVVGSPHYLSPEQIRGEELDGRSDLFSLGVVLYELLGSRRPFEAETLTALIYQILNTDPPPPMPPAEPLSRLNGLVRRMMAKEREERYRNAAEVVAEISALERELPREALARPAAEALPPAPEAPTRSAGQAAPAAAARPAPAAVPPRAAPAAPVPPAVPRRGSRTGLVVGLAAGALLLVAAAAFVAWSLLGRALFGGRASSQVAEVSAEPGRDAAAGAVLETGTESREGGAGSAPSPGRPPAETTGVGAADPPAAGRQAGAGGETLRAEAGGRPAPRPAGGAGGRATIEARERPSSGPSASLPTDTGPPRAGSGAAGSTSGSATPPLPVPSPPRAEREVDRAAAIEPEEEPAARPALRYDREVSTGMTLRFAADPADAFVLVDGRLVGKASELSAQGGYTLPEAGDHLVVLRKEGREEARLLVRANPAGGTSTVPVRLGFREASTAELGDLQLVRVQQAVGFKVEPKTARVLVDGVDRGEASDYGGLGRGWLKLPAGRHRLSLVAPGHRQVDVAVEVSSGAAEERETIRLKLPPEGG